MQRTEEFKSHDDFKNMVSFDISSRKNNRQYPQDTNEDFHYKINVNWNQYKFNCCGVSAMSMPVSNYLIPIGTMFNCLITIEDENGDDIVLDFNIDLQPGMIGDMDFFLEALNVEMFGLYPPMGEHFFKYDNLTMAGAFTQPGMSKGKVYSNRIFSIRFRSHERIVAPIFGFDISTDEQYPVIINNNYFSPFVVDQIPFSVIYLCCDEISSRNNARAGSNVLCSVFYNGAVPYSYNYQDYSILANKKYMSKQTDTLRFYLLDEDFQPVNLQGIPFFFKFHMWLDENEDK